MYTFVLIALATFASEDLTCIATGALIAQGRLGFVEGTLACITGIFAGDLALFAAGRLAGRRALAWPPVARYVPEHLVSRGAEWLKRKGMVVVLLSRFTPGLRLPTYFAAGLLPTPAARFAGFLLIASAIWTPLLVAGSTWFAGLLFVLAAVRHVRLRRWEFWPSWAIYLPLVPYLLYLAIKYRSLTLFTAANPGIPTGGFAGESKSEILRRLSNVPKFVLLPASLDVQQRHQCTEAFVATHGLPVVLKPNVGERGSGVVIARTRQQWIDYVATAKTDIIVQQYVSGPEFGIFYCRRPHEAHGHILSITEKRFPCVVGDGRKTIKQLIAEDIRARTIAETYERQSTRALTDIPEPGERVQLVEVGSHCRGAIFLDARHNLTPELEAAIDRISQTHPEFYFGRYDIRAESAEALRGGHSLRVIELNGVSAEATHVYDPAVTLIEAYRVLAGQWRIAFEIGAENRDRGFAPTSPGELARAILGRG